MIVTIKMLVMDELFSVEEYDQWDAQFQVLDSEFCDFIPCTSLNPEFVKFVADKHSVAVTDFTAIQSIA